MGRIGTLAQVKDCGRNQDNSPIRIKNSLLGIFLAIPPENSLELELFFLEAKIVLELPCRVMM